MNRTKGAVKFHIIAVETVSETMEAIGQKSKLQERLPWLDVER